MNTIKVYAHKPGPVSKAILQVIGLFQEVSGENAIEEADAILITEREHLNALYRKDKPFGFILTQTESQPSNLPENVFVISAITLLKDKSGIMAFIEWLNTRLGQPGATTKSVAATTEEFTDIPAFKRNYRVLVLDNDRKNLRTAEVVLKGHTIVKSTSLQDAATYFATEKFDAVLTDMQMPLDKHFGALSADAINPALEVPYGFAMIFEATKRGLPIAVVTDGNHHQDWVSAMFDHIKGATVNGQKVLFFNHIGKRWDRALKSLMEE